MLDRSNPIPSSNKSPVNSPAGIEKCCHNPGTSTNLKSTISTLFFLTKSSTSLTAIYRLLSCPNIFFNRSFVIIFFHSRLAPTAANSGLLVRPFVMLAQVEPHTFLIIRNSESHDGLNNGKDDVGSDQGQDPSRNNGDALYPQLSWIAEEEAIVAGWVDCLGGKKTG